MNRRPRRRRTGVTVLGSHLITLVALLNLVFPPSADAVSQEQNSAAAEPAPELSIERAVTLAQERNELILIALQDQARANAVVKEAYSNLLPNIEVQGTYQRNFTKPAFFVPEELVEEGGDPKVEIGGDYETAGQIRVDQVLYAFGRLGNALSAAKLYKRIATLGVEDVRGDLIFGVKQAYYRVLLAEKVAAIQMRSLEQAESHLADIESKLAQGTVSRFDFLRAQVEVKNRQPELIGAENDFALAMQDLKRIVGIDSGPDPVLTDTLAYAPMDLDENAAIAEAFSRRPEILSLQLNVERSQKWVSIEKAGRLPTLGLFGQLLFQGQANDDLLEPFDSRHRAVSSSAGIALTMPIFDGFRTKARIQQAQADHRRAEHELSLARKAIRLEVVKAVKDLESLRRAYDAQQATVSLAEETYAIAETRFANGLSTQLELTDAETALEEARVNFAMTLYGYDIALAHLERVLGRNAAGADPTGSQTHSGKEE